MCIARQCHTSLEGIQIDFSWKRIPAELYQAKKASFQKHWFVLWAPTSAPPQCQPVRLSCGKCALTPALLGQCSPLQVADEDTWCCSLFNSCFVPWSGQGMSFLCACRTGNGMTESLASPLSFSRGLKSQSLSLFEKRSVQRRK